MLQKRAPETKSKSKTNKKEFDISRFFELCHIVCIICMPRYRQRHIALHIQYDGGNYFGFSSQNSETEETVEKYLFEALQKLHLIENRKVITLINNFN